MAYGQLRNKNHDLEEKSTSETRQRTSLDGKRERRSPSGDLLAQLRDLLNLTGGNLRLEVLQLVRFLGQALLHILAELDGLLDVSRNATEVLLAETAGGHGRSTDTDTARRQGRLVAGNRVLVAGDVDLFEDGLNTGAVEGVCAEIQEDHV